MGSSASTPSSEGSLTQSPTPSGDSPTEVRRRIRRLKREVDTAYIQLGRDLYLVYHRRLFVQWGHDTWTDYVEQEVGISQSRGDRLRRIWSAFVKKLALKQQSLNGVGYTNAFVLLPLVNKGIITSENVDDWLQAARTLSYRDLELKANAAKGPSEDTVDSMAAAGVPVEPAKPASEATAEATAPIDPGADPRAMLSFRLYPQQHDVVRAAIEEAMRGKAEEMAPNEALANVATEFLASRMSKEEKPLTRVSFLLGVLEQVYGGKFVWIQNDEAAAVLSQAMDQHPDLFTQPADPDGYDEEGDDDVADYSK